MCVVYTSNNLEMDKIRQVNKVYQDVCCKTQHVKFVDTYSPLFPYNYRDVTTDGTHPNNKGLDILKYTISEGVKNAINITREAEYPPPPQKYVRHDVQNTAGIPSKSEDKTIARTRHSTSGGNTKLKTYSMSFTRSVTFTEN